MRRNVREDIRSLQEKIIREENKIIEFLNQKKFDSIKKSLFEIHSDLKYLSILANGAPIDKKEDRKVMQFLRVHYENLQKLSIPA